MPKITAAGGPSNAREDGARVDVQEPIAVGEQPQERPGEGDFHAERNASEESGYTDFSKEDLVAELKRRDLATTGNKPELVERLEEDDEKRDSEKNEV